MENELRDLIIEYGKNILPRIAEYEIHSSTFNAVVPSVIALVLIAVMIFVFVYRNKKRDNGQYCGDPEFDFLVYCGLGAIAFLLILFAVGEVWDIYYAKYLPEKLLIRYLERILENM